jgi:signal peptidase I
MSDDAETRRESTGGARMSGSREGFGLPPWDPADPVPEAEDTEAISGLGAGPETAGPAGPQQAGQGQSPPDGPDDTSADAAGSESPQAGADRPGTTRRPVRRLRRRSFARELPVLIVVALVLAFVIKTYAIQAFYIPSGSMENTLDIGDRVLVNKLVYDFRGIHRGDIIVFNGEGSWDFDTTPTSSNLVSRFFGDLEGIIGISHDSDIYIKRVIGLPGDRVACCDAQGRVTVNGVALNETSYLYPGNAPSVQRFNITVPQGRLWVMGDHRLVSYDSRGHMGDPGGGTIPESSVLGRAFVIIWPPSRWRFLGIPATFDQPKLNASAAAAGGSSATLAAAMDDGTPLRTAGSALPLALGFAGAVPLTWLQRRARRRLSGRLARRR